MIWLFLCSHAFALSLVQGIPTTVNSLDPFSIAGIDAYLVTGNVIEPLARSNPRTGAMIPVLAKSWTLDPENKTFRVRLKDGVKFHNGQPLTADDVRFTFEAYFKPEYQADIWRGMWSDIEAVRAIDKLTVEFKMKSWKYQAFETALTSLRILPKSFYAPADREKFRTEIIGTGPFKLASFAKNIELEPNPEWHGKSPRHRLILKTVGDSRLAAQMMEKGELDFYEGAPVASKFRRSFKSGLGHGFWIDLNMAKPLFQKEEVRRALQMVWRREDLNQKVFAGLMKPALDIFSPLTDVYPRGRAEKYDLKAARALLKSKGWKDEDHDGVLFEFTVLVKSAEQERWVTLFQNDAQEAGIKVLVYRVEDDNQWWKRLKEGRFDAAARDGGLINEVTSLAWSTLGPYNYQKFSDPEIDRLTSVLEGEFDLKKRRLILRKAISILRERRPVLPGLYSESEVFLISRRLEPDADYPSRAWSWKLH